MDREEVIIRAAETDTARRMGADLRQGHRMEQGMAQAPAQAQVPDPAQVQDLETVMEPAQKVEKGAIIRQIRS